METRTSGSEVRAGETNDLKESHRAPARPLLRVLAPPRRERGAAGRLVHRDGRKHLLHLAVGNKESEACWTGFFRNLLERGMRAPTTATSDGAPGLIRAIQARFPASLRIRCWFHRLANIRAKLPEETAGEVLAHVYAVRDAPTRDAARAAADRFINT